MPWHWQMDLQFWHGRLKSRQMRSRPCGGAAAKAIDLLDRMKWHFPIAYCQLSDLKSNYFFALDFRHYMPCWQMHSDSLKSSLLTAFCGFRSRLSPNEMAISMRSDLSALTSEGVTLFEVPKAAPQPWNDAPGNAGCDQVLRRLQSSVASSLKCRLIAPLSQRKAQCASRASERPTLRLDATLVPVLGFSCPQIRAHRRSTWSLPEAVKFRDTFIQAISACSF